MAIIGNRFSWDPETRALLGNLGDHVHTLNKEVSMKQFFEKGNNNAENAVVNVRQRRSNVILLGDALGDARMTMELGFVHNVIKVFQQR